MVNEWVTAALRRENAQGRCRTCPGTVVARPGPGTYSYRRQCSNELMRRPYKGYRFSDAEDFLSTAVFVGWSLALLEVIEDVALSPAMPWPKKIFC